MVHYDVLGRRKANYSAGWTQPQEAALNPGELLVSSARTRAMGTQSLGTCQTQMVEKSSVLPQPCRMSCLRKEKPGWNQAGRHWPLMSCRWLLLYFLFY